MSSQKASGRWVKLMVDTPDELENESLEYFKSFIVLICRAARHPWLESGTVKLTKNKGHSDELIASDLIGIPLDEWLLVKEKLVKDGRISVEDNNVLTITKWDVYQGAYKRQAEHRQRKKQKCQEEERKLVSSEQWQMT